ncbi:MAG: hypothetical protein ABWX96_02360 [Propionibacteriaceae bacterium]
MTEPPPREPVRPWHRALVYAVTGQRHDVAESPRPDVEQVADWLRSEQGLAILATQVRQRRAADQPWPYPVPADLMSGLGYAQFSAALTQLLRLLDLEPNTRVAQPDSDDPEVVSSPSAGLRRLLEDVPPHHGS